MYGTLVFLLYKVGSKQVLYMYCEIINVNGLKKCVFLQQTFLMTHLHDNIHIYKWKGLFVNI